MKKFNSSINEAPYQIFGPHPHASSDSEAIKIGKEYKDKKRARNRAERLNQEIGGHRYTVKKVEEDTLTEGEKFISSRNRQHVDKAINRLIGRAKQHIEQGDMQSQRKFASFRPAVQRKKNYHYDQAQKFTNFVGQALNALDKSHRDEEARRNALFKEDAIIDYLVNEGYVDDYDSAIKIYESMSDEWLKEIVEGFVPLDDRKIDLVKGFIKKGIGKLKKNVDKMTQAQRELTNNEIPTYHIGKLVKDTKKTSKLVNNAQNAMDRSRQERIAILRKKLDLITPQNSIRKFQRNDVEYALDYLINEGFTDSYEGAEAILESMSDEWLKSIILEENRKSQIASKSGRTPKNGPRSKTNNEPSAYVTVGVPGSGKSTIAKHMVSKGNTDQHELDKSRQALGKGPAYFGPDIVSHTYSGAKRSADMGRNTVLSNTSIPRQHRQDAIKKLKDSGYKNVTPILSPGSTKAAMRRNRKRTGTKPGEGAVPQFVMNRMARGMKQMSRSERKELRSNYKKLHKQERFTKPAMKRSRAIQ